MRLWHQKLIHYLPKNQLLGQHRECCALRGKGWGRKHSTVDYVFKYEPARLYNFHLIVMREMSNRGWTPNGWWYNRLYRGESLPMYSSVLESGIYNFKCSDGCIFPEHDDRYLLECLMNLKTKGVELVNGSSIEEMLLELQSVGVQF